MFTKDVAQNRRESTTERVHRFWAQLWFLLKVGDKQQKAREIFNVPLFTTNLLNTSTFPARNRGQRFIMAGLYSSARQNTWFRGGVWQNSDTHHLYQACFTSGQVKPIYIAFHPFRWLVAMRKSPVHKGMLLCNEKYFSKIQFLGARIELFPKAFKFKLLINTFLASDCLPTINETKQKNFASLLCGLRLKKTLPPP